MENTPTGITNAIGIVVKNSLREFQNNNQEYVSALLVELYNTKGENIGNARVFINPNYEYLNEEDEVHLFCKIRNVVSINYTGIRIIEAHILTDEFGIVKKGNCITEVPGKEIKSNFLEFIKVI